MINISNSLPIVLVDESSKKRDIRKKARRASLDNGVELIIGEKQSSPATYIIPVSAATRSHMEALKKQYEESLEPLKIYVDKLINRQAELLERKDDNSIIALEDEDVVKLNNLISENGEFGIYRTADRIVEFAKTVSGGDKAKIEQIKEAINNEFTIAKDVLGEIPKISQETYDEVMKRLDKWELDA